MNLEITQEIEKLLQKFADNVIERAQRNLKVTRTRTGYRSENGVVRKYKYKSNAMASGKLYNSLKSNIIDKSDGYVIKFYGKGTQNYADVIEKGRRPNSTPPPTAAIESWLRIKKIKPRGRMGQFIKKETDDEKIKKAAYLISKKIGKYGIEGIHYWQEAIDAELENIDDEMEKKIIELITLKINEGWL